MAQPPPSGARRTVAQFVQDKMRIGSNMKAIQPMLLSVIDEKFYWAVKVIEIKEPDRVGITRKYEAGFVVLEHGKDLKKIKSVFMALKGQKLKNKNG